MPKQVYLFYLEGRLTTLRNRMHEVRQRLERDNPIDRVRAAGELAILERRTQELTAKIGRVRDGHDGLYAGVKTELEEDVDSIGVALNQLFSGVR